MGSGGPGAARGGRGPRTVQRPTLPTRAPSPAPGGSTLSGTMLRGGRTVSGTSTASAAAAAASAAAALAASVPIEIARGRVTDGGGFSASTLRGAGGGLPPRRSSTDVGLHSLQQRVLLQLSSSAMRGDLGSTTSLHPSSSSTAAAVAAAATPSIPSPSPAAALGMPSQQRPAQVLPRHTVPLSPLLAGVPLASLALPRAFSASLIHASTRDAQLHSGQGYLARAASPRPTPRPAMGWSTYRPGETKPAAPAAPPHAAPPLHHHLSSSHVTRAPSPLAATAAFLSQQRQTTQVQSLSSIQSRITSPAAAARAERPLMSTIRGLPPGASTSRVRERSSSSSRGVVPSKPSSVTRTVLPSSRSSSPLVPWAATTQRNGEEQHGLPPVTIITSDPMSASFTKRGLPVAVSELETAPSWQNQSLSRASPPASPSPPAVGSDAAAFLRLLAIQARLDDEALAAAVPRTTPPAHTVPVPPTQVELLSQPTQPLDLRPFLLSGANGMSGGNEGSPGVSTGVLQHSPLRESSSGVSWGGSAQPSPTPPPFPDSMGEGFTVMSATGIGAVLGGSGGTHSPTIGSALVAASLRRFTAPVRPLVPAAAMTSAENAIETASTTSSSSSSTSSPTASAAESTPQPPLPTSLRGYLTAVSPERRVASPPALFVPPPPPPPPLPIVDGRLHLTPPSRASPLPPQVYEGTSTAASASALSSSLLPQPLTMNTEDAGEAVGDDGAGVISAPGPPGSGIVYESLYLTRPAVRALDVTASASATAKGVPPPYTSKRSNSAGRGGVGATPAGKITTALTRPRPPWSSMAAASTPRVTPVVPSTPAAPVPGIPKHYSTLLLRRASSASSLPTPGRGDAIKTGRSALDGVVSVTPHTRSALGVESSSMVASARRPSLHTFSAAPPTRAAGVVPPLPPLQKQHDRGTPFVHLTNVLSTPTGLGPPRRPGLSAAAAALVAATTRGDVSTAPTTRSPWAVRVIPPTPASGRSSSRGKETPAPLPPPPPPTSIVQRLQERRVCPPAFGLAR